MPGRLYFDWRKQMRKRVIAVIVALSVMTSPLALVADEQEEDYIGEKQKNEISSSESYHQGMVQAKQEHGTGGWIAAGLISGGLFSWLGTGVTVLIATGSSPSPDYIPEDTKDSSFIMGYQKEAKKKNVRSAAIPGVIMSSIWTALVIAAASSQ